MCHKNLSCESSGWLLILVHVWILFPALGQGPKSHRGVKINNTKSREKQIEVSNIVLNKRGFAFVDLQDNVALDKAIEKLSGMKINGKEISVEHSGIF